MPDEILMEVRYEADPERLGPGLLTGVLNGIRIPRRKTVKRCLWPAPFTSQRTGF